jgi:hypothetical protein
MQQDQIHPPGQQQAIQGGEQLQAMGVGEPGSLQAEIDIRTWLIRPRRARPKQPKSLCFRLGAEKTEKLLGPVIRNPRNGCASGVLF